MNIHLIWIFRYNINPKIDELFNGFLFTKVTVQ